MPGVWYSAVHSQKAVNAYFPSKQLLPSVFAERFYCLFLCRIMLYRQAGRLWKTRRLV